MANNALYVYTTAVKGRLGGGECKRLKPPDPAVYAAKLGGQGRITETNGIIKRVLVVINFWKQRKKKSKVKKILRG